MLQLPLYVFTPQQSPDGALAVTDNPALASAGMWLQHAVGAVFFGSTGLILAARLRRADRTQRRVLLPLGLYGIVAVLLTPVTPHVIEPLTGL